MSPTPAGLQESLRQQLVSQKPFALLHELRTKALFDSAFVRRAAIGSRLMRPDELPGEVLLLIKGEVRLLVKNGSDESTLCKRGAGQLLGWSSLIRAEPCEWVQASTDVEFIAFPGELWVQLIRQERDFASYFFNLPGLQEAHEVALAAAELHPRLSSDWDIDLIDRCMTAHVVSIFPGEVFKPPVSESPQFDWFLSSGCVPDHPVGLSIEAGSKLPERPGFLLPYRIIGLQRNTSLPVSEQVITSAPAAFDTNSIRSTNLEALGILEDDNLNDSDRFPCVRGRGPLAETLAVAEMVSLQQQVPFRRDSIAKVLEDQFRRDKLLSVEMLGGVCELMGLRSQLAETDSDHLVALEAPALFLLEDVPVVLYGVSKNQVTLGHPHHGLQNLDVKMLQDQLGDRIRFVIPRRVGSTPTSRFGWSWFTPLLGKYKVALAIVFIASLLAQLFGLAIPLLIQQIIDKVLGQGNLSSLNVLGVAMVVMALFQGLLKILRSYIFVDTTDRMDLTLGSAVIDRLLSLPLTYFEKRPVGELSQRVGELNTIRGFLTGTALVSLLNLIFATLYLIVMLVYSPLLTAVALSTLPIYILIVFGVSPLYKYLIRKRAVAQARTQSHLIEVLGGIQTVKAQHFELTARWKWQDRYRLFVDQGFKSVALGTSSGEVGAFLNQLSGLLILWVGMWLVLQGNFTLGQLIAFRIIASSVTGPLLQLSTLYQVSSLFNFQWSA